MELIYRGNTYSYNPDKTPGRPFQQVRESGSAYNLTYRGVNYRIDPNTKSCEVPRRPAAYKLIYRGMTYWVNRNAQGEVTATTASTSLSNHRTSTNARPVI